MVGESVKDTCFSEVLGDRFPLLTIAGLVQVAGGGGETPLTVADPLRKGFLLQLYATCTTAGTTAGNFVLKDSVGGTTLLRPPIGFASPTGTVLVWQFDMPWKTAAINAQFTLNTSAASVGTWQVTVNGFYATGT